MSSGATVTKQARYTAAYVARCRAACRCVGCQVPVEQDRDYCAECHDLRMQRQRERRETQQRWGMRRSPPANDATPLPATCATPGCHARLDGHVYAGGVCFACDAARGCGDDREVTG